MSVRTIALNESMDRIADELLYTRSGFLAQKLAKQFECPYIFFAFVGVGIGIGIGIGIDSLTLCRVQMEQLGASVKGEV